MTGAGSTSLRPLVNSVAHALPAEDVLGDDRAAEDAGEVERHQGGDRDERVAERVPDHDAALGEALRPGRAYVVLVHDLEHARPGVARVRRERDQHERHAWAAAMWPAASQVSCQKSPSKLGVRAPIVEIGRPRTSLAVAEEGLQEVVEEDQGAGEQSGQDRTRDRRAALQPAEGVADGRADRDRRHGEAADQSPGRVGQQRVEHEGEQRADHRGGAARRRAARGCGARRQAVVKPTAAGERDHQR